MFLYLKTIKPISKTAAQHGVQVMPLARPQTWRVFHARSVPSSVPSIEPASGTPDAQRWAALNPSRGCRTVPAARHHQAYSEHTRTYPGIFEYEMIIAYRIVRRRNACRRARRRIACRMACRVPSGPSPDRVHQARHVPSRPSPGTASGMVVTYRRARRRIASIRLVTCRRARRRARRQGCSSRAVAPVAGTRAVAPVARSCVAMVRLVSATSESLP